MILCGRNSCATCSANLWICDRLIIVCARFWRQIKTSSTPPVDVTVTGFSARRNAGSKRTGIFCGEFFTRQACCPAGVNAKTSALGR